MGRLSTLMALWGSLVAAAEEESTFLLRYHRAAQAQACPEEPELRRALAARLGRDPFVENGGRTLQVRVAGDGAGALEATLVLVDAGGTEIGRRSFHSPHLDCRELADSMLLAIALTVDPLHATLPARPAPSERSAPPLLEAAPAAPRLPLNARPPPPPPVVRAEPSNSPPPIPHWRLETRGWLGAGFSANPYLALMGSAGLVLKDPSYALGLELRAQLPSGRTLFGGDLRSSVLALALTPCLRTGPAHLCGLLSAGATFSEAVHLPEAQMVTTPWAALGARAELNIPLGQGVVLVFLELAKPLIQTRFRVEPVEIWRTPELSGSMGTGYGRNW